MRTQRTYAYEMLHGSPVPERVGKGAQIGDPVVAAGNVEKLALWLRLPVHAVKTHHANDLLPRLITRRIQEDMISRGVPVHFAHAPRACPVDLRRLDSFLTRNEESLGHLHGRHHMLKMFQRLVGWAREVDSG